MSSLEIIVIPFLDPNSVAAVTKGINTVVTISCIIGLVQAEPVNKGAVIHTSHSQPLFFNV